MSEPLIIYHGSCRDGFCAAWVAHKKFPNADFFEGRYGEEPPDVTGREVFLLDFSYKRPVLTELAAKAENVTILDHHKTAKEDLEGLDEELDNVLVEFDMERSGAGITWDYFMGTTRPWLVDYVEARDIWKHDLPSSREISAYLGTIEFEFEEWDQVMKDFGRVDGVLIALGEVVMKKTHQYVREVAKNAMTIKFEDHNIPVVNAPQVDISELLHFLAHGKTFSMGWFRRADGMYQYSLRSIGDFDVSEIAKKFGGGGHKNAAGFQLEGLLSQLL